MNNFDIVYKTSNKNTKYIGKKQFNILVVDDDEYVASTLTEILTKRGHTVTYLTEGLSCISKCQYTYYDIIFMDFHLDDMNGVDVIDVLKEVSKISPIVFAFTGDDSSDALYRFKNIGMVGAIIKPIDISIINKLMNSLELRKELDNRIIKTISMSNSCFRHHLIVF